MKKRAPPQRRPRTPLVDRERRAHLDYKNQFPNIQDETARRIREACIDDDARKPPSTNT